MSAWWQFKALVTKNVLILRRNVISTLAEILFPMILMVIIVGVRKGFKVETFTFKNVEGDIDNYIKTRSVASVTMNELSKLYLYNPELPPQDNIVEPPLDFGSEFFEELNVTLPTWKGFTVKPILSFICPMRPKIALVGRNFPDDLKQRIYAYFNATDPMFHFNDTHFETLEEMNEYVADDGYGTKTDYICFGIFFDEYEPGKYNYTLSYFDSWFDDGVKDYPQGLTAPYDPFQKGPHMEDFSKFTYNGYMYLMTIMSEYVIMKKTGKDTAQLNLIMMPLLYEKYGEDPFGGFTGFIVPFFMVIAYMCPLILYVYRMVGEKETRAKEGMKIMGMGEGTYFFSYLVQYFVINIIYTLVNAGLCNIIFTYVPYIYLVGMFFLFGLNVFALVFFFQSFMDKTRVALILSLLIYFVMFFLALAVFDEHVAKSIKMLVSIFPPVVILLGVIVFGEFESKFEPFKSSDLGKNYKNFSINSMYLMLFVDIFIYLFLGYYLQNVIPHDFGMARPWYFLCTRSYWCGTSKKSKAKKELMNLEKENNNNNNAAAPENPHKDDPDFQNEDLYKDKTQPDDYLKLLNIVKTFDDKKTAVDGVSFNIFKDEIFALLGHNGAGKSTLISMLSGLYEATSGEAYYNGVNILDDAEMDNFRRKLGICPQHDVLFEDLTMAEHLKMFCYFKGVPSDKIEEEVQKTLKDFRIADIQGIIARNLSAGQRRKLSIAIAIIGGSEIIFLDEPSSGMDITSRRNLWEILKSCIEKKIIILTTHYMEEASVLGNRIGIIADGKMKCIGSPLFLIERFGKFMSVNVVKQEGANNDDIISFFTQRASGIEYEILSQEILFRIPRDGKGDKECGNDTLQLSENSKNEHQQQQQQHTPSPNKPFSLSSFFKDLDDNLETLKIKTYSASMPTLEDVFLNVASSETGKLSEEEEKRIKGENNAENDEILFADNFKEEYSACQKFNIDLRALLYKRLLQIFRDLKSFVLEILCPIILVLIGLAVSKVTFFEESKVLDLTPNDLVDGIKIYYASHTNDVLPDSFLVDGERFTSEQEMLETTSTTLKDGLVTYLQQVYDKNERYAYAGLYVSKLDVDNAQFEGVMLLNAEVRIAPAYFAHHFYKQIVDHLCQTDDSGFKYKHTPMPQTTNLKSHSKETNNYCLVFFVNVAFSLIPANFVTLIVKERVNNSKHLMKISGVGLVAYWMSNYIFEIIKYYVAGGVNMLLIWAFDLFPDYLWVLYLLYGPSMVSCTYLLSYAFVSESTAQNGVILINFVFGALGSSVCLMFRSLDSLRTLGKSLAFVFRLVPSFCFGYGFNQLLNGTLLLILDNPLTWITMKKSELLSMRYIGSDNVYMAVESVLYLVLMVVIEKMSYTFKVPPNERIATKIQDEKVLQEIERANEVIEGRQIEIESETPDNKVEPSKNTNNGHGVNSTQEHNVVPTNMPQGSTEKLEYQTENKLAEQDDKKGSSLSQNKNDNENVSEEETKHEHNKPKQNYSVHIKNIQKIYNKAGTCCGSETITAIKNLSFCIEYGECFGLLGLNGAGKTTTFRCLTQETAPSNGVVYIDGLDISSHFEEVRHMFGYCPQFDAIFEYMTVYENLELFAKIKGVRSDRLDEVIKAMINEMSLTQYKDKVSGKLSGGNKRKLAVAISMICNPPIILLDEPSTGMDPEARRFMWAVIHKISTRQGKSSVIMTTHSMDEAETLCRRMGIMVNGEFVCLGSAQEIKDKYGSGFEIDVRIMPLKEETANEIYETTLQMERKQLITRDEVATVLEKLGKKDYMEEISEERIGNHIEKELKVNERVQVCSVVNWTHYVTCAMKMIKKVKEHFNDVILSEHIENNFLFKVKKEEGKNKSIGFLFGLIEENKQNNQITEYSIQQTSLEQIFNKFAANQGKTEEELANVETKLEFVMEKELLDKLTK